MHMMNDSDLESQDLHPVANHDFPQALDNLKLALDIEQASIGTTNPDAEREIIDIINQTQLMPSRASLEALFNASLEQAMTEYETKDLLVKVHKPEKIVKAMESYVSFTVSTKTTRELFEKSEYSIKRRYNDFLWLRQQLSSQYPVLIIPPLPEKQSLTIDRFDKEFVRFREAALNAFLNKVSDHPILSHEKSLYYFLTMDSAVFRRHRKETVGFLSAVTNSLNTLSTTYQNGYATNTTEYKQVYKYADKLSERLSSIEKITHRLELEQADYIKSLAQLALYFSCWSGIETSLSTVLSSTSEIFENTGRLTVAMMDEMSLQVILPVREYVLFSEVVKASLSRRDNMQRNVQSLTDSAEKLKELKERMLNVDPSSSDVTASVGGNNSLSASIITSQVKKSSLDTRISEAVEDRDKAVDLLEVTNADFRADLERWHIIKKRDMKKLISGIAERNITYYDEQISLLEVKLAQLREWKTRTV